MAPTKKNNVVYMLLCDHFLADQQGKASFIGVFETINFASLPAGLPRFYLAASVQNATGDRIEIVLTQPDGSSSVLISQPLPASHNDRQNLNIVVEFANLSFTQFGLHKLSLQLENQSVKTIDLTLQGGKQSDASDSS